MIAWLILAVALTALLASEQQRAQLAAAWRIARAAIIALISAALAAGYLLRSPAPAQDTQPAPSAPLEAAPTTPTPHEVDHAPVDLLDPLPNLDPPDLGSAHPADDLDSRIRALDVRARQRRR